MQDVILYATETMADWEYGYLLAGLAMAGRSRTRVRLRVQVASEDGSPPSPQQGRGAGDARGLAGRRGSGRGRGLVLPGADTWFAGHETALDVAERTLAAGGVVAAIRGATYGLCGPGLLDDPDFTPATPATSSSEHPATAAPRATARACP